MTGLRPQPVHGQLVAAGDVRANADRTSPLSSRRRWFANDRPALGTR